MGNTFSTNELKACISQDLGIDVAFPFFPAARDKGSTACCVVDAEWLEKLTAPRNAGQVVILKRPMRHLSAGNVPGSDGQQPKQSPTTNIYVSVLSKDPERQIHFDLYRHSSTSTADKFSAIEMDQALSWGSDGFSTAFYDNEGLDKSITALVDSFHEYESFLPHSNANEKLQSFVNHIQRTLWPNSRKFHVLTNDDSAQIVLQEDSVEPEDPSSNIQIDLANSNVPDVFGIIESQSAYYFLASYKGTTLQDLITYNPGVLSSNLKKSFIVYQLIRALASLHSRGILHGRLNPSAILVDENLWIQLAGLEFSASGAQDSTQRQLEKSKSDWSVRQSELESPMLTKSVQEDPLVMKWIRGEISNFSYLMALNHFAGRREGDPNFHPILPWITDFSGSRIEDGWRDFTKTKFRMNKGDEQLDFTFDGPVPHHITDILSDITYYVYLARRTPIPVLCQFVRSKYEPNEYPSSMQRLYSWTPDECIPEFYTDPSIFKSIHPDMPDLQAPQWASSPEDFIAKHAAALESEYVSENLHHWIDLTFGNNLTGKGAVEAKNVALPLLAGQNSFMKHGIIQLFKDKHPQRGCNWNKSKKMTDASLARKNINNEQQTIVHDSTILPDRRSSKSATSIPSQRSSKIPRQSSTSSSHLILSESPTSNYPIKECASSIHSTTSSIETSTSMTSKSVSITVAEQIISTGTSSPAAGLTLALRTDPIRLPQEVPDDYFIENLTHFEESMSFASKYKDMQFMENLPINPVYANSTIRYNIDPCTKPQIPETEFSKGAAYDMYCAGQIIQSIFNAGNAKFVDMGGESLRDSASGNFEVGNGDLSYDIAPIGTISMSQTVTDVVNALTASQWQDRPSAKSILCASMPTVTIRDPKRSLPIPECIPDMYEYLASFHQAESSRRLYLADKWIDRMSELEDEAFLLVLPTFTQLFSHDATRVGSISLFPKLAQRLGPEKARKHLLKPIIFMFEALRPNIPKVLFSHRTIDEFVRRLGTATFLQQVLPCYLEAVAISVGDSKPSADDSISADNSNLSVPELAGDAVLHVCVVLGPILTSKHIIRQLTKIVLRENASRQILLQTFGEICQVFGETFASIQFSYLLGMIDQYNKQAVTEKNVLTLMSIMKLLEEIAPAMSSASLATELKSGFMTVFYNLLEPLTIPENQRSLSEKATKMRLALSLHTIEHLVSISRYLVIKDWETTMTTMLQKYFSGFTTNITSDQSPQPGMFPEPLVAQKNYQMMYAYYKFAELVGGETMHRIIPTSNSIDKLLCDQFGLESRISDEDSSATYASVDAKELRRRAAEGLPLASSTAPLKCNGLKKEAPVKENVANKEVKEKESKPKAPISVLPWKTKWKPSPEDRKNWNRFLSTNSEEMSKSMQFSFNDLKLRGYAGHTAAIRTITVNEPRKLFASGARDRTVKIWSLNVHDGIENWESNPYSECLVTYNGHRRGAVTDVHFLIGIGRGLSDVMASCDGTVHLWDPETGKGIHQFAIGRPSMVTIKPIFHSRHLVGGTTEGNLIFLDAHNHQLLHTWKSNANLTGSIRVIAVNQSDTLVAIGFSTGAISLLESRTGTLVASWKGGDTEITMLKFYTDELLVSCAPGDHQICCWNVSRLALLKTMSAPQDVISLDLFKDEILTINNNNSISFTPINDELQSYSSKFKPSIIKSQVSAFAIVPTDPSLLFGCTEGEIFLYA